MNAKLDINPAEAITKRQRPFIYFHTYDVTQEVLDTAIASGKSLELDMSVDDSGEIFIGHPLSFYDFKKLPAPNNLPLDEVLEKMKAADLYLMIDCKDVRALSRVREIVSQFGKQNCMFHSWVQSLLFKPYPSEIQVEPHWPYEDLPDEEVFKLHDETGVPVIVSCRGLTQERLKQEGGEVTAKISQTAKGRAVAVNFNLPNGEAPPMPMMKELSDAGVLTWLNIDKVPVADRPPLFLGVTDFIVKASDPKAS